MKTTFSFGQTKRKHIVKINDSFFYSDKNYANKKFEKLEDTKLFFSEFNVEADTLEDAYTQYSEFLILKSKKSKNEAEAQKNKALLIQANSESYSPLEIYEAAIWLTQNTKGWQGANLLLKSKIFSDKMFESFTSFTVSPFDNGELRIKADGKKFGNFRPSLDLEPFLK